MSVCALALEDGGTEEQAIAALLHDVLEDHPEAISADALERGFGSNVCRIVAGCTDTPPEYRGGRKPPWRDRKAAYLAHLRTAPADVRRVALADKVHNLQELLADLARSDPARVWSRFNAGPSDQIWFYRQVGAVLRDAGQQGTLMKTYERALAE
jgi:(p)ppGpp synthase/HD superfamily hydrolase